jgi:hypothetical protein
MATPDVCTVTGTLCKLDGTTIGGGAQISATVKSTQADQGGQVAGGVGIGSMVIEALTNDDGTFQIQLVQGVVALLEIPAINLRKEIAVPAVATADFATLI